MEYIYLFLAEGFEEVEALGTVDVLRRAGLPVKTVSVMEQLEVTGSHQVTVKADMLFDEESLRDAEMLILPGGMPGSLNLSEHEGLRRVILAFFAAGRPMAAICAAPMVYGKLGLLKNKKVTCYPGFEEYLEGAVPTGALVEHDANIITGKGPGATFEFAMAIVAKFCGKAKVAELKQGMLLR